MHIFPAFVRENGTAKEDKEIEQKLWSFISIMGNKKVGPVLEPVLSHPELFGIKSAVRQELIAIVLNTLRRAGFTGDPVDVRTQSMLEKVLKLKAQQQDGGFF